jgi:FkbM family methyltransferase
MSLKQKIIRLLYPHGSVRRVRRGAIRGARFVVSPGMGATYAWGHEVMNQGFLATKVRPGMVVYDVGANRGQMALYFSKFVGSAGKVLSFEPAPANFDLLERNLRLNDFAANVQPFKLALAADNQPREFTFHETDHTQGTFSDRITLLESWETLVKEQVQCDTIDQLVAAGQPVPHVLKIDVEGSGAEVLQGAIQTLREHGPAIYLEVHASSADAPEWLAFQKLQNELGYQVVALGESLEARRLPIWGGAAWCERPC